MLAFIVLLSQLLSACICHSWVEQVRLISAHSGEYFGQPGYMRGYVPRTPSFRDDFNQNLLPRTSGRTRLELTDPICRSSQKEANYTTAFPKLVASPGDFIALRYLENGHVTLPHIQIGKPGSGGTILVYATTRPAVDETIGEVLSWSSNTSRDSRGRLLTVQNFDDGRCYQINNSPLQLARAEEVPNVPPGAAPGAPNEELWCETNVQIPVEVRGDITVYWVWEWSTLPARDLGLPEGKAEWYTSCLDITVIDPVQASLTSKTFPSLLVQDPHANAVTNFKERAANTTVPEGPPDLWI
ncbi:hypothetical protein NA57DRAFT_52763 [Rhizodiscina lignyota]|uniref:DUF7492 domain-containing protein n=1 Tax=Rhizodiscina lignyota TaxID=1504668 RepID=A0A9P4INS4_9PEZI|nr:hypothetical protein NA57DRAFT_52763 [Rhizodiscina lignyota]